MPANFAPPDLTQVLAQATSDYQWNSTQAKEAKLWYERFLQLRSEDFTPLYVMSKKADQLWHTHFSGQFIEAYKAYCAATFGQELTHMQVTNPHTPSAAQLADAEKRYKKHNWWPIPDSWTGCS